MLLNFSFKNFKCYKDSCNFSMVANKDSSHPDNLIPFNAGKDNASKVRIIYGANASGKTSFIEAIAFVRFFATHSNNLVENSKILINPYKFRENYQDIPSEFNLDFIKNNVRYVYNFSCTYDKVISEKLDAYYTAKPTNIFTRTDSNKYKFSQDTKILNEITSKNTLNKLFLITAATWNYDKVKPVVDFLFNDIMVFNDIDAASNFYLNEILRNNHYNEYKTFCIDFLNNADISINDFKITTQKIKDLGDKANDMIRFMNAVINSPEAMERFYNSNVLNIKTFHNIKDTSSPFALDLSEESEGTQQLFRIAPILFYVFKKEKVLFIDEIDRSLHPLLVEFIIKKFHNNEKNNAQLICNTHDTNLLDLDLFRRDEVWFTERNYETASAEMYPLSEFSPRKDENIEKAYLLGRYGAIPFIKEF